eukprot:1160804-Pelagomonas_calceolata.AAC.10
MGIWRVIGSTWLHNLAVIYVIARLGVFGVAGRDQQAEQPNHLVEGQSPMRAFLQLCCPRRQARRCAYKGVNQKGYMCLLSPECQTMLNIRANLEPSTSFHFVVNGRTPVNQGGLHITIRL